MIPFNKPYLSGNEFQYIKETIERGRISGDGYFTKKCHDFFKYNFGFGRALLTTSCTDALEMAAILLDIKQGDEVIVPSYTFVSTVNAFALRGAKLVFVDSTVDCPNMDVSQVEKLITPYTKAIICVHYAGVACDMDEIMRLANKYKLKVVEDAAQAITGKYKESHLGSIGHLAALSFHETKNIISGEGGLLVVNDEKYFDRAEIIREKGTNRSKFFRGEVDKYGWVDIGSSFLPSDMIAAFLYAQLENIKVIQERRQHLWGLYNRLLRGLEKKGYIRLPRLPSYSTNNAHMFYIITKSLQDRTNLIECLKSAGVYAAFHYQSLHSSDFFKPYYKGPELKFADFYSDCLLRLPLYYELGDHEVEYVVNEIVAFYER